jgi:RHS repeat-associated protein
LQQYSPDGDTSVFFYDRLGRLTVSQNKEQKDNASYTGTAGRFSFTKYDVLGRINQVAEKSGAVDIRTINLLNDAELTNWVNNIGYPGAIDRQLTKTIYDNPINLYQSTTTSRKRVVASIYLENANDTEGDSTLYAYDILGNVKTLVQHVKALVAADATNGKKQVDYEYDLVSGKVNMVSYQPGKGDQFFYKYLYDADNRVIRSLSSRDKLIWLEDASYTYYLHGPLARTELGQYKVQGVDYAYTLQGWLKGINSNALSPEFEMGQDGWVGTSFERVSRDVYSYGLGYYNQDYTAIGGSGAAAMNQAVYQHPPGADNTGRQLFNGNISHTEVALSKIDNGAAKGYSYGYDQLNRLVFMNQHTISGSTWSNTNIIAAYAESIAYDANGNILKYLRKGANGAAGPLDMDSLNYKYNRDVNGNIVDNRLNHVRDQVSNGNYTVDIDNQSNNNYTYDKIGNLKTDVAETISNIDWTVYGKIKGIVKSSSTVNIEYGYDPGGNRTWKKVNISGGEIDEETNTWYIRDAQGNTLAVYSKKNSDTIKWEEQHLYGSSRLGMWNWDTIVPAAPPVVIGTTPIYDSLLCGSRTYELSNHLGNVLVTVSDRKLGVDNNSDGVIDYYVADVVSATDNYVFGMTMPGRSYQSDKYRFGFNGKEKDKDISSGDLDFGARIYDGRIGRWLSVDPLQVRFPGLSPYNFCYNSPLNVVDPDGKLGIHVTVQYNSATKTYTVLSITIDDDLKAVPYSNRAGKIVEHPDIGMNYFNYAEITFVDGNGKVTSKQNKTMSFRTNNWAAGKWWAKAKVDDGDYEDNGGVAWTSQDGGNEETRKGRPSHASNIELLMTALSATKGHLEDEFQFTGLEFLEKLTSILEKIPNDNEKSFNPNEDPSIKKDLDALKKMLSGYEENKTPTTTPGNSTPRIEPGKSKLHPAYLKPKGVIYSRRTGLKTEKTKYGRTITSKPATDTLPEQKGYDAHYPLDNKQP